MTPLTKIAGFSSLHATFAHYIINQRSQLGFDSIFFEEVDATFGDYNAKYLLQLHDLDREETTEMWVVYSNNIPFAIAIRILKDSEPLYLESEMVRFEREIPLIGLHLDLISDLPIY